HSAVLEAAPRVGSAARKPVRIIADVRERLAAAVHALREIARPFESSWHCHANRAVGRGQSLLVLLAEKEEELILSLIEELWNPDRPADGVADVALIELRLRREVSEIARCVAA